MTNVSRIRDQATSRSLQIDRLLSTPRYIQYVYGIWGWVVTFVGKTRDRIRSAHARVARADRAGHAALVAQSATDFVRCQNSSGQLRSRSIRAPRAVGWTPPGDGAPGWMTGAMSEHSCDAHPGALSLPHGARPHLSRVCVRSAGARSAHDSVAPAVRLRRQRGPAAAVLVPPVGRTGGYCCCDLLLGAQPPRGHT